MKRLDRQVFNVYGKTFWNQFKDLKCYVKYMEKAKWKNLNTCKRV